MAAEIRAYLRSSDVTGYALLGEITEWVSFAAIKRRNAKGTWRLVVNRSGPMAALITKQSGIVIKRNNVTVFSGNIGSEYTTTATTLTVAGWCDNALLDTPALPDTDGPPYVQEFWAMTGQASAVMSQLAYENVGAGARIDRRAAQFVVPTDPALGGTVVVESVRFDNLLQLLTDLAVTTTAGDLRFWVQQSDIDLDTVVLTISAPRDQRAQTLFAIESGTAADYKNTWQAPPANYFYVAGGDALGKNRTILEGGNAGSIAEVGRQIEAFVDVRLVTDGAEHSRKLQEAIDGGTPSRKVTVTPFQVRSLEFVDDYDLGDLVTFVADGETFEAIVQEVEIVLTKDHGAVITPMLGDAGTTNDSVGALGLVSRQLQATVKRVSNLERAFDLPEEGVNLPMLAQAVRPPIGQIASFVTAGAPVGWVIANGDAINRTTYADLFASIGTAYGAGDGTTTFNVPDLRDRIVIGSGITYSTGQTGTLPHDAHDHPGTHDHTHTHKHDHDHDTDLDHNHPNQTIAAASGSGGSANLNALGSTIQQTQTNSATPDTTDDNSANAQSGAAFSAAYSGANTPYFAALVCIYSGI